MGITHKFTLYILVSAMIMARCAAASAGLVEQDGFKRARIAECFNNSASQMLLLQFDSPLRNAGTAPPAWQTLPSETPDDFQKLDDILVISAYDMIITGNCDYAEDLRKRGIVREVTPLWKERFILVGPVGRESELSGLGVPEIMKRIHAGEELFFSMLNDISAREAENELWNASGVSDPQHGKGYVETGRDSVAALMQAGDERGFMLVGEASFALYADAERFDPALTKISDTDYCRTSVVCVLENSGFRKDRAANAAKYAEWFASPEAKKIISSFSLGGINPFSPAD